MRNKEKIKQKANSVEQRKNNLIERPKLNALLEQATKKQAVTLIAGPGYGKSISVSFFLRDKQKETAWLTLTSIHNITTEMWEYFCAAFYKAWNIKDVSLINLGFPDSDYTFEKFIKILTEKLNKKNTYYLVLDDFYYITNSSILHFVEKLILAKISNLRIIIISRKQPLINTVLLLSKDILYSIDASDLRLSEEEMYIYFYKQGIEILESAISEFYEYTEGWFFATSLVCLSLEPNKLYKKNPFSAVELDIHRLLESEIYSSLPHKTKQLLLKLSLLENPPFELALQLAGEQTFLDEILDISSFIVFDKFSNEIFIHKLFLDFLLKKTNSLSKVERDEIHLFSARWYEENGYRIDAIIHYEQVQYYGCIIDILLTFNKAYPAKTMDYLLTVIDRIPQQFIKEKPIIRVLQVKFLMNNYHVEKANKDLLVLQHELENLPLTPEIENTLGEIYVHLAFQSLINVGITHTYEFVDYFKMAHQYLPSGSNLTSQLCVSCGNYICIISSPKAGEMDKFIMATENMLPFATKLFYGAYEGYNALAKAEFSYFQKNIKQAEKYIYQALREAQNGHSIYVEIYALYLHLRLSIIIGNYDKIQAILIQQKQLVKQINTPKGYATHDITRGWFYAQLGETDKVPAWIKDEAQSQEVLTPTTFASDKLVRARVLLKDKEIYKLLALLDSKSEGFTLESNLFGAIEMLVLKAIALSLVEEYEASAEVFTKAYELSAPNKIIMPFIENGKYTRTLINRIFPYLNIPLEWLKNIQTKATTYAKKISNISMDLKSSQSVDTNKINLSQRETEILIFLCQNLTRKEIADNCELSINTVKSLINSIYNKLGVESRIDAVRIATQLNLF